MINTLNSDFIVVQVLEEHEEISKSEFEKLEKQLRKGEEN